MKSLTYIVMLVCSLLLAPSPLKSQEAANGAPKVVLVDVVRAKLVALDPRPGMSGASNHWRVTLKNMRVIDGEGPALKGKFTIDVYLDDTYVWTQQGRVVLVVTYTSRKDIKVLDWSHIHETICIRSTLVPAESASRYTPKPSMPGFSCGLLQ